MMEMLSNMCLITLLSVTLFFLFTVNRKLSSHEKAAEKTRELEQSVSKKIEEMRRLIATYQENLLMTETRLTQEVSQTEQAISEMRSVVMKSPFYEKAPEELRVGKRFSMRAFPGKMLLEEDSSLETLGVARKSVPNACAKMKEEKRSWRSSAGRAISPAGDLLRILHGVR